MAMSPDEARRRVLAKQEHQAGIPQVPNSVSADLRRFLSSMRENLAVRMGQEGSDLDKAVTFRDLTDQGILVRASIPTSGGFQSGLPAPDLTPPPTPTGLTATGGFGHIMLTWNDPELSYHYRVEVYRNTEDVLDQQGDDWRLIGTTTGAPMFVDNVGGDRTVYYYWVRYVRVSSPSQLVNGNFSSSAEGQVSFDPTYVKDQLEGQLTESELAQDLLTPIQKIPVMEGTLEDHDDLLVSLQAATDNNYAAIELKADTSVVEDIDGNVQDILAQATFKLDVNGYVSGIGLMNDGVTSSFIVASDAAYFIDPGQSITAFDPDTSYSSMDAVRDTQLVFGYAEVEGQKRFVSNVPAYIPEAYITSLMVKDGFFENLKVGLKAEITNLVVDNATIWDLTVGNTIQSSTYTTNDGWRLTLGGTAIFNDGIFRGHVEADSGYIASTLQIGGTGRDLGEVVQMAENAGDTSLFEEWIRPGTTLINGNKIYTGDVYVDTAQIKGQAVTFPTGVRSNPWRDVPSGDPYPMQSLSFSTPQSAPGFIFVSFMYESRRISPGGTTREPNLMVGVELDGTYHWPMETITGVGKGYRGVFAVTLYIPSVSAGSHTIRLRALRSSYNNTPELARINVGFMQAKR